MALRIQNDVPLGPRTTLGVGGAAKHFIDARTVAQAKEAWRWARDEGHALHVLGGGSNMLVADRGVDGAVLRLSGQNIEQYEEGPGGVDVVLDVDAGHDWDELVAYCVDRDLAGLECLSGIPGMVGAAPIQNVGAYGQEVSETIQHVEALDLESGAITRIGAGACEFDYRDSAFKRELVGRYLIVGVCFRLKRRGRPKIAYPELQRALGSPDTLHSLAHVRATVIALRRNKSMVLDPRDENRRSAGSFFVNPILDDAHADEVVERAKRDLGADIKVPRYPAGEGRSKLAAAWLIERAGFAKGTTRGRVGISTKHSLAVVNKGGATATELVAFATEVRRGVLERFGVTLHPEPRTLGFEEGALDALYGAVPDGRSAT